MRFWTSVGYPEVTVTAGPSFPFARNPTIDIGNRPITFYKPTPQELLTPNTNRTKFPRLKNTGLAGHIVDLPRFSH
jgi:hypothetical protein